MTGAAPYTYTQGFVNYDEPTSAYIMGLGRF